MNMIILGGSLKFLKLIVKGDSAAIKQWDKQESDVGGFFRQWSSGCEVDIDAATRFPGDPTEILHSGSSIEEFDNYTIYRFFARNGIDSKKIEESFNKYPDLEFTLKVFAQSELVMEIHSFKGQSSSRDFVDEIFKDFQELYASNIKPVFGTFTDPRDGQTYKTVKIGDQEWFAENLKFDTGNMKEGLYHYEDACNAVPEGWHIPSAQDFRSLSINLACKSNLKERVGALLKSKTGWLNGRSYDAVGFDAKACGYGYLENEDDYEYFEATQGCVAAFWSSTENNFHEGYADFFNETIGDRLVWILNNDVDFFYPLSINKSEYCALRPIKNSDLNNKRKEYEEECVKSFFEDNLYTCFDSETGSFTDPRDGQVYKTVEIDGQIWLAENLRYKAPGSYSVDDDESNDKKCGRLYTWESLKNAAPDGWEVCSSYDIDDLDSFLRKNNYPGFQGIALRTNDSGWYPRFVDHAGVDACQFNALPVGYRNTVGEYRGFKRCAYFWTIDDSDEDTAIRCIMPTIQAGISLENGMKEDAYSVRLVKKNDQSK